MDRFSINEAALTHKLNKVEKKLENYKREFRYLNTVLDQAKTRFIEQEKTIENLQGSERILRAEVQDLRRRKRKQAENTSYVSSQQKLKAVFDKLRVDLEHCRKEGISCFVTAILNVADEIAVIYRKKTFSSNVSIAKEFLQEALNFQEPNQRLVLGSLVFNLSKPHRLGPTFIISVIEETLSRLQSLKENVFSFYLIALAFTFFKRLETQICAQECYKYLSKIIASTSTAFEVFQCLNAITSGWSWSSFLDSQPELAKSFEFLILHKLKGKKLSVAFLSFQSESIADLEGKKLKCTSLNALTNDIIEKLKKLSLIQAQDDYFIPEKSQMYLSLRLLANELGWAWSHDVLICSYIWPHFEHDNTWLRATLIRIVVCLYLDSPVKSSNHFKDILSKLTEILRASMETSLGDSQENIQVIAAWSILQILASSHDKAQSDCLKILSRWYAGYKARGKVNIPIEFQNLLQLPSVLKLLSS